MGEALCSRCRSAGRIWHLKEEEDVYCSICGTAVREVRFDDSGDGSSHDVYLESGAPTVVLRVRNRGVLPVRVLGIETTPPSVCPLGVQPGAFVLGPSASEKLCLALAAPSLGMALTLLFHTEPQVPGRMTVFLRERPSIGARPRHAYLGSGDEGLLELALPYDPDRSDGEPFSGFELYLRNDTRTTLRGCRFRSRRPELEPVVRRRELGPDRPLEVHLKTSRTAAARRPHQVLEDELECFFDGLSDPVTVRVRASWKRPPELRIHPSFAAVELWSRNASSTALFRITNSGELPACGRLGLDGDGLPPGLDIQVQPASDRLLVEPGASVEVQATATLSGVAELGAGRAVTLSFEDAATGRALARASLSIEPRQAEALEGFLSVDFGTSNTCAAYRDLADARVHDVAFRDPAGRKTTVIPSAIFFEDVRDPAHPVYAIGYEAIAKWKESGSSPHQLVTGFKRAVGKGSAFHALDRFQTVSRFKAEDLCLLFLDRLVEETAAAIGKLITRVHLTFPAIFSPRQVRLLEAAARGGGTDSSKTRVVRIDVDEANAGALDYILEHFEQDSRSLQDGEVLERRVFVYDFGGGTTDIGLLSIQISKRSGRTSWRIVPRGLTGRLDFGGEDVTRTIAGIVTRCLERAHGGRRTNLSIPLPQDPHERAGPNGGALLEGVLALENERALLELAERVKIDFYAGSDQRTLKLRDLAVGDGLRLHTVTTGREPNHRTVALGELLNNHAEVHRSEISKAIEPDVQKCLDRAWALWQEEALAAGLGPRSRPDVFLLTGRSSKLPLVRELCRARFGLPQEAIPQVPPDAKEKVARGALEYLESQSSPGSRVIVERPAGRVLLPIGFQLREGNRWVCETVFPAGTPVPPQDDRRFEERRVLIPAGGRDRVSIRLYQNLSHRRDVDPEADDVKFMGQFTIDTEGEDMLDGFIGIREGAEALQEVRFRYPRSNGAEEVLAIELDPAF